MTNETGRNVGGRPLKFQSVEELDAQIADYFENIPEKDWTWTGLALHLDTDKWTLTTYKERDGYSASVKKALLRVENSYEKDLKHYGRSGTIFALKNFDWKDKTETELTLNHIEDLDRLEEMNKQKLRVSDAARELLQSGK